MKPLLVSSGEPAGIGPDLCIALARYELPVVILGDKEVLEARSKELKQQVQFREYNSDEPLMPKRGQLNILPVSCPKQVRSGVLNPENASYVLELLTQGATLCDQKEFSGLVTAPIHKANINAAGIKCTGHTEFLADFFQIETVVMMLACEEMKVALVTTHLPLRQIADALSPSLIINIITQLHHSLIRDFGIVNPRIKVAGLNPHAGESGYLGREEIDIIRPALEVLKEQRINLEGPLPADTMFTRTHNTACDAYVAMYHDQGLPVLKYAGFGKAVNITLGLPIIRTSVDHGTALELAGTGQADEGSMLTAVEMAQKMVMCRIHYDNN